MDTYSLWTRGQLDTYGHDPSSQSGQAHAAPPPQSRAPEIMATTLTVTLVCAFIVGIRLFTRFYILKNLALDDWLIVVATCFSGILTGVLIQKKGLGMHTSDLNMAELSHMMLRLFWAYIVYSLAVGITKISIVFSYLRVFASTKRTRIACLVTLGFLIANTFQAVLTSVLSCHPVWLFWHPEKALLESPPMRYEDHCLNLKVLWFLQGSINIVFDFVLIVLPMPVLKSLRISHRERYALMSIFALGGFGCIVSFLRLRSLHEAVSSKDAGWDNVNSARWSVIEVTVGIMCASLPQCKALVARLFPRWLPGGHRPPTMKNVAVSNYDKGHGWHSRLADGIKLDQMQRTQMSQKGGIVLSNVEKGTVDWDSSEDSGEASGAAAIIVTTTMTQRRESHCYDPGMFELPRNNSITPSEISLPPFLSAE